MRSFSAYKGMWWVNKERQRVLYIIYKISISVWIFSVLEQFSLGWGSCSVKSAPVYELWTPGPSGFLISQIKFE